MPDHDPQEWRRPVRVGGEIIGARVEQSAGMPTDEEVTDLASEVLRMKGLSEEEISHHTTMCPSTKSIPILDTAGSWLTHLRAAERLGLVGPIRSSSNGKLPLSRSDADKIEAEMRRLEADPAVTKTELRVFMQLPMPCGHATGNLLTCPEPPYGCVICGEPEK